MGDRRNKLLERYKQTKHQLARSYVGDVVRKEGKGKRALGWGQGRGPKKAEQRESGQEWAVPIRFWDERRAGNVLGKALK